MDSPQLKMIELLAKGDRSKVKEVEIKDLEFMGTTSVMRMYKDSAEKMTLLESTEDGSHILEYVEKNGTVKYFDTGGVDVVGLKTYKEGYREHPLNPGIQAIEDPEITHPLKREKI